MAARPPSVSGKIPELPWFARTSNLKLCGLSLTTFLLIFTINLLLDFFVSKAAGSAVIGYIVSDAVAALLATAFLLTAISLYNDRRTAVRHRLYVIAEMNHHVRNALDSIQMSAQLTQHRNAIEVITEEVNRIDWALKEILGTGEKQ